MSLMKSVRIVGKEFVCRYKISQSSFHSLPISICSRKNSFINYPHAFVLQSFSTDSSQPKKGTDSVEEPIEEDTIGINESPNDSNDLVSALQKEIKELKDKVVRSYAEEENVRRIAKRDVDNARSYANTSFAKALLDVADDLDRALTSVPKSKLAEDAALKSLHDGISMTEKQLHKVFNQFKVTKFGAIGDKFDPSLHDALFQGPDPTKENGTISQILKSGYKLNDRVIRAAQVGTVSNPAS
jgi:molecular chaperone GrpE